MPSAAQLEASIPRPHSSLSRPSAPAPIPPKQQLSRLYTKPLRMYNLFNKVCVIYKGRMVHYGLTSLACRYFVRLGCRLASRNSTYPIHNTNTSLLSELLYNNSIRFMYPLYLLEIVLPLYIVCISVWTSPQSVRTGLGNGSGTLLAAPCHQAAGLWEFSAIASLPSSAKMKNTYSQFFMLFSPYLCLFSNLYKLTHRFWLVGK